MRFVERAVIKPSRCAVLPQMRGDHERGYVDTGSELPGFDNHVYVSVVAIEEMGKLVGLPSKAQHEEMQAELQELRVREAEYREELTALREFRDAVELVQRGTDPPDREPGLKAVA